jgi:uncharacterized protein (TIGR02284 family)
MSTDKNVTKDLMEVLADGREGFTKGAEKLDESNSPELATVFRRYGDQRASFYGELEQMAREYGDNVEESGSIAASLHRGWMSLKDAVSGSSPKGVIDAAEQGEDHAMEAYQDALESDISPDLRSVVQRQLSDVQVAHATIRDLKEKLQAA